MSQTCYGLNQHESICYLTDADDFCQHHVELFFMDLQDRKSC